MTLPRCRLTNANPISLRKIKRSKIFALTTQNERIPDNFYNSAMLRCILLFLRFFILFTRRFAYEQHRSIGFSPIRTFFRSRARLAKKFNNDLP